jgi:hypothetical protein
MEVSDKERFLNSQSYVLKDLIRGEIAETNSNDFSVDHLSACGCKVIRITPV